MVVEEEGDGWTRFVIYQGPDVKQEIAHITDEGVLTIKIEITYLDEWTYEEKANIISTSFMITNVEDVEG